MHEAIQKKSNVMKVIEDIKGYKKGQKALYRKYYEAKEELDKFLELHALSAERDLLQEMCYIDTSDIFYKKN